MGKYIIRVRRHGNSIGINIPHELVKKYGFVVEGVYAVNEKIIADLAKSRVA